MPNATNKIIKQNLKTEQQDKNIKNLTSIFERIKKIKGSQILSIPNTPAGDAFYEQFKRYFNSKYYTALRRGRGSRKKHGRGYMSDLPMINAEWIALYVNLDDKKLEEIIKHRTKALRKYMDNVLHAKKELHGRLRDTTTNFNNLKKEHIVLEEDFAGLKNKYDEMADAFAPYEEYKTKYFNLKNAYNITDAILKRTVDENEKLKRTSMQRVKKYFNNCLDFFINTKINISISKGK